MMQPLGLKHDKHCGSNGCEVCGGYGTRIRLCGGVQAVLCNEHASGIDKRLFDGDALAHYREIDAMMRWFELAAGAGQVPDEDAFLETARRQQDATIRMAVAIRDCIAEMKAEVDSAREADEVAR